MPYDRSEYPDDWEIRSKFVRFIRADGKCEWCGAKHGKPHPITGSKVILTTAHIFHCKSDNSLLKLAALCQKCHLNHDLSHHIRNRKYGRNKNQLDLLLYTDKLSFKQWIDQIASNYENSMRIYNDLQKT